MAEPGFVRRYLFSLDHKVIGIQYLVLSMFMALCGGAFMVLMRMNLAWPGVKWPLLGALFPHAMQSGIMKPEFYLSLVTMHGTVMIFFVISLALASGIANFIIPLQIGARDMAFPVLNMLSFWTVVPACIVLLSSFAVDGGAPAAGWTAYPPLSAVRTAVPGSLWGQTLWIVAMALFIISFTMGGINFITTILEERAQGMSLFRMPLTIWSYLISSALGLMAFPALFAAVVLLLCDRHFGTSFYLPSGLFFGKKLLPNTGGTPLLWQHLFWFLGHPEVYVLAMPAWGIVLDLFPVFTRRPVFGYRINVYCFYAIAVLSLMVWGHHMYVSGMSPYAGELFSLATLAITIPSAVLGVNMLASLWGGAIRFRLPMMFAIGSLVMFGSGGFGGMFLGNATSDIQLHDTYFVVGHFHLMIGGVTLLATFAALHYWYPRMFGRMMDETLGRIHFWLTFPVFYLIFVLMHFDGLAGMPRRYYSWEKYDFLAGVRGHQVWISLLAFLLGAAQLLFVYNFFHSIRKGRPAEPNPWDATTLEWQPETSQVYRWPYDYSVPGAATDFTPQNTK
ncbi:MAG: cbb3-type cytochrome c oxidase subunit I [Acidobacteria bacterium]|nr:cbb3-type cytochrome c oxidase subunit I [Acidobacteriota bacterium]